MSLCLAAGVLTAVLNIQAFTLAWEHSIEKIRWEEDWQIENGKLVIVEARIRGTGAGMEPPEGAKLIDGVWHYRPELEPLASVTLANSPSVQPYEFCHAGACRPLAALLPAPAGDRPIELSACADPAPR